MNELLSIIIAYMFGSIPTAVWASKTFSGMDIRKHGSGNAGLTNVYRVLGWKPAIPVVVVDLFKGVAAPYVAMELCPGNEWVPMFAGLVAILGHSFTCMAGFRGGKGVLTALGVFLCLAPYEAVLSFLVWLAVLFTTRYVSLASILACLTLGISVSVHFLMMNTLSNKLLLILGWVVAAFVIIKHKSNISRLLKGTENRFGKKKEE